MHERLDVARWIAEFPLGQLRADARDYVLQRRQELPQEYADDKAVEDHIHLMYPQWGIVVGPSSVAVNEQLKQEALTTGEPASARLPTDVAIWARGESENRAVTKIGGLPYRPSGSPWPRERTRPMRFIAQLSFVDSLDLVPSLPGDILLVFGDDEALVAEPERLVFEWWPSTLSRGSLVSEMPLADEVLAPFHAVLHRTEDWETAIFEGTKIGGVPRFIQDEPIAAGPFIGAIGSISVAPDQRHPFVNVEEPPGWSRDNNLMIGDMGSLYLFIDPDGKVQAVSQCY